LVYFFPVLVCCTKNNLAALTSIHAVYLCLWLRLSTVSLPSTMCRRRYQCDQSGRIFAFWAIAYFWQL
jgi:hypothetical protein